MPLDPRMGATPPNWMPYFGHEDVERLVDEVGGLGGQVLNGPIAMSGGRDRGARDPQGAIFAVWTGTTTTDMELETWQAPPGDVIPNHPRFEVLVYRGVDVGDRGRCSPSTAGAGRGSTACSTSTTSTRPRTRCSR